MSSFSVSAFVTLCDIRNPFALLDCLFYIVLNGRLVHIFRRNLKPRRTMSITHIVLLQFKQDAPAEAVQNVRQLLYFRFQSMAF